MKSQNYLRDWPIMTIGDIIIKNDRFAVVDGPFGTQLHKSDYVANGVPLVRIQNITRDNRFDEHNLVFITEQKFEELSRSAVFPGDILLAKTGATIGKVCLFPDRFQNGLIASSCAKISIDKTIIYTKYVLLFLSTEIGQSQILNLSAGSTRNSINLSEIKSVRIPVPPLETQKKIVAILERADELKRKREQTNQLTNKILQSVFLKMFGDPIENPRGWKRCKLEDICIKITDGTHNSPPNSSGWVNEGVPYVTAKNVKPWGIDLSKLTYIKRGDHELIYKRCNPEKYDVLYIKDGVKTGIAAVNLLDFEFSMLSSLALFKPDRVKLNTFYLQSVLNTTSTFVHIVSNMKGAAIKRLTLDQLKVIEIPLPPVDMQNRFGTLAERYLALQEKQKELTKEINQLFDSVMHKAFKGELVN